MYFFLENARDLGSASRKTNLYIIVFLVEITPKEMTNICRFPSNLIMHLFFLRVQRKEVDLVSYHLLFILNIAFFINNLVVNRTEREIVQ